MSMSEEDGDTPTPLCGPYKVSNKGKTLLE